MIGMESCGVKVSEVVWSVIRDPGQAIMGDCYQAGPCGLALPDCSAPASNWFCPVQSGRSSCQLIGSTNNSRNFLRKVPFIGRPACRRLLNIDWKEGYKK
ncbi:hypothetical protein J6590_018300 [Homalodisca vitripennis]|nr:hypothetical protein J6590_018300 [Homalodisca vitripennis]